MFHEAPSPGHHTLPPFPVQQTNSLEKGFLSNAAGPLAYCRNSLKYTDLASFTMSAPPAVSNRWNPPSFDCPTHNNTFQPSNAPERSGSLAKIKRHLLGAFPSASPFECLDFEGSSRISCSASSTKVVLSADFRINDGRTTHLPAAHAAKYFSLRVGLPMTR